MSAAIASRRASATASVKVPAAKRLALAQRGGRLFHLLLQSRLAPGQFELMLRQDLQFGRFLRREFLQIAANRLRAQGSRIASHLFLVAEKLGHLAVEAAVVVPLTQPVQHASPATR